MIKRSSIDNLAASIDISDLISSYVPLKKNGVHSYVGLCPFHDDRSPSMHVSSDKGLYHCFACGAGGNIFKFIMEIENIDFASAVEKIADMYNISLEYSKTDNTKDYKSAANVLNELNASYKLALFSQDGARALKYLKERGINDAMIERFELGWAGSSAISIACLQNANIAPLLALKAGAIKQNQKGYYASFIERISFPIYNHIGTLVGFGGRTISGHLAKYVNSPQSEIFDKSRILYGYDKAKNEIFKRKEMIICEGYMDCIMLHLAGFTNAVAVLGTALTPKHLPLIKKENIKVILSFDSDTAGENAAFKSAGLLALNGIDGRAVLINGGKDPAELVASGKANELKTLYSGGVELVEFYIRKTIKNMPLNSPNEKLSALEAIRAFTRNLRPEIIGFYEPLVSSLLGIDIAKLNLAQNNNQAFKNQRANFTPNTQNFTQNPYKNAHLPQSTKDTLKLSILKNMLLDENLLNYAKTKLIAAMFGQESEHFNAVINNPNDENNELIRALKMDESLEQYDFSDFKRAINRLLMLYFERKIAEILASTDANKSQKIKDLRKAIAIIKNEGI